MRYLALAILFVSGTALAEPPKPPRFVAGPAPAELSAAEVSAAFAKAHPGKQHDPNATLKLDIAHESVGGAELILTTVARVSGEMAFFDGASGSNGLIEIAFQAKKNRAYLVDCRTSQVSAFPLPTVSVGYSLDLKQPRVEKVPPDHGHYFFSVVALDAGFQQISATIPGTLVLHSCTIHAQKI